jgi:hypothetical protein
MSILTFEDVLKRWGDHPDVIAGKIKTYHDWTCLFGEALSEGETMQELLPYVNAVKQHFEA